MSAALLRVGQLRRWTCSHPPVPSEWYDLTFMIVAKRLHWVDPRGVQHASIDILVDGQLDQGWRDQDILTMSEVIDEEG